ncbi:hypothetical protein ACFWYW_33540 [Nonomuraea sp. NPDC059023]|uniref:hypothetical protein n=1 Tax=unclassified Nonomuraea TaxID=2593643 RepID=UPI0036942052
MRLPQKIRSARRLRRTNKKARTKQGLRKSTAENTASRARAWIIGIILAGLAAVLTDATTGSISSLAKTAKDYFFPEPPLRITPATTFMTHNRRDMPRSRYFFVNKSPKTLGPPPKIDLTDYEAKADWARKNEAMDASCTYVYVVVDAQPPNTVVLTGISMRILARRPPPKGVVISEIGAGPLRTRSFYAALDEPRPNFEYEGPEEDEGEPERPIDFPYRVSDSDPEVILLIACTEKYDIEWRAELAWVSNGISGKSVIDNQGTHFRTIAETNAEIYTASDKGWEKEST